MSDKPNHASAPDRPEPYWRDSVTLPKFPKLENDIDVDVVVVGGGISGITSAYLLAKEGVKVALIEANQLLNGTTGHTTAKITAQHNLFYDELIQHTGKLKAKQYYESNLDAIRFIDNTAKEVGVDCEFEEQDAFIYATTDQYAAKIEKEFEAYKILGIDGTLTDNIPFAIDIQNAIKMKHQAQFHPLKFLIGLVDNFKKLDVQVYEDTVAVDIEDGLKPTVITRDGPKLKANFVLICSHFPFYGGLGFYFARMHAKRAYIVAGRIEKPYPGGMYISAETPSRSLRSVRIDGEEMVLISGEDHKTGQGKDTMAHYQTLEDFGQTVLGVKDVRYRWSTQDLFTLDKIPYIGTLSETHPNVLVATGYKKWGMTTGVVAAQLLRDIVLSRQNEYHDLYDPSRFYADPSLRRFLVQNIDVAGHLIKGKFDVPDMVTTQLNPGEGGVVTFEGERAGAYKDEDGHLFVVDTTCTHLRCEVNWNHGDKTWDCPCHGSRFSFTGDVIEGPAKKPLTRLD